MAASQRQREGHGKISQLRELFDELLDQVILMIDRKTLHAMKRYLSDVISLNVGSKCQEASEFIKVLAAGRCISEHDVDLLEDLLEVSGLARGLSIVRGFTKKRPSGVEFLPVEDKEHSFTGKSDQFSWSFQFQFQFDCRSLCLCLTVHTYFYVLLLAQGHTHLDHADHVRKTTPLDISLGELRQNSIVLERENVKIITYPWIM